MQTLSPELRHPAKEVVFSSPFLSLERVSSNIAAIEHFAKQNGYDSHTLNAWDILRFLQHQDLPLIPKSRVNPECVWFCENSIEFAPAVKSLMGKALPDLG